MDELVPRLQHDYPTLSFMRGETACWSPRDNHVFYTDDASHGAAGLLHELAHALLNHQHYTSDVDLLHKEVAAWEKARALAVCYDIKLNNDHIEDCLDTYRDWLHKRSTCPNCLANGVQAHTSRYTCLNCSHAWRVSTSRLCRPYRLSEALQA